MSKWLKECWMWTETDIPLTRDEFVQEFFPQSLSLPFRGGGIKLRKNSCIPVDHNRKGVAEGRMTRFKNKIDAAYSEYRAVHPNKTV